MQCQSETGSMLHKMFKDSPTGRSQKVKESRNNFNEDVLLQHDQIDITKCN